MANKSSEQTLEEQKAAAKARNLARKKEQKRITATENLLKQYDTGVRQRGKPVHPNATEESKKAYQEKMAAKKDSDQLLAAFRQLVARLIDESKKHRISDVDWFDNDSVARRKAQFSNIKDLISIVKSMREVIDIVIAEESKGQFDVSALQDEKIAILEDARKALQGIGLNKTGL